MRNKNIYRLAMQGLFLLALTATSCTSEFENWNHNPNEATDEQMKRDNLNTGAYFAQMERGVFIVGKDMGGEYQITEALEGDLFASYFATITSWGYAPHHNDHYALYDGWYNAPFNDAYKNIMTPWLSIYKATDQLSPARAMATVVKVLAMQRITDAYGPIPYSKFGTGIQIGYDAQKDVYDKMFNELDSAITVLTDYVKDGSNTFLAKYDNVYQGNVTKWVKMANTLRLRMAMRISYVDEAMAKTEAQAAMNNSLGLMSSADDDAILHQSSTLTYKHPLWEIGTSWDDEHMSATMDCYLNGYSDPRIASYFQKADDSGVYAGVRNGLSSPNKSKYKGLTSRPNYVQGSDMSWVHAAEAYLLMAEAKLRWDMGTMSVKDCYEQGVKTSFASAGVSGADTYLSNDTNLPKASFIDAVTGSNTDTSKMLSMLTVAWDDNADADTKLERIMIQKWIALYPDGQEAWSEMRRTGYPGWVRIQNYSFQNEVKDGEMISRLKFPTTEYTNNGANAQAAVKLLGGSDVAGTRLWWDVKRK